MNISKIWLNFSGDPDAVVLDPDHGFVPLAGRGDRDLTPIGSVLGGVVEEIDQHLDEPDRVCFDPQGRWRKRDRQTMAAGLRGAGRSFAPPAHRRVEIDVLFLQYQFALGDPRHVQQVLHQPRHLLDLSIHQLAA